VNTLLPLFDANGWFGCPCTGPPAFRIAADYLAHLDRLGVQRGLVWHAEAQQLNPITGNRRLITELRQIRDATERLVPSFVIGAQLAYERGAVEELKTAMRSHAVRALRVFPGSLQHTLGQLEPVIEAVLPLQPVLLFDRMDALVPNELLALAERFPSVPMVYMQGMWPNLPTMLDLMRRRPNVLVDTSWIHTRGSIELIARQFGAERLLFSLGFKSHAGASIAELARVELPDPEREKIAHGNLEKLLGLTPITASAPKRTASLWHKLLDGQPLGVDLVDAHGHMGPLGRWVVGDREWEEQIPDTIRRMEKIGMRTMIISGTHALFGHPLEGNRLLEQQIGGYGERFRGYFVFNPFYAGELAPVFDEFFARPFFVGFKIHTSAWRIPVTDRRFEPVWQYAHHHRLPILLHTWEGPWDTPSMLTDIVKRYPDAIFLLGHSGGGTGARPEAEQLAIENPNVHLEWCGSFTTPLSYEETIRKVGHDRVVFGTDGILHSFVWELGRLLSLDVPEETLLPVLGANMRKLLSLRR
jgi:hypothetical protein